MKNLVTMYLYKIYKSPSTWIMLLALAALTIREYYYIPIGFYENFGYDPAAVQSVFKLIFIVLRSGILKWFILAFVVLFIGTELSSGYIKNLNSTGMRKYQICLAKLVPVGYFVLAMYLVCIAAAFVGIRVFFGFLPPLRIDLALAGLSVQLLLHMGFACFAWALTCAINNRLGSLGVGIALLLILPNLFNDYAKSYPIFKYTLTYRLLATSFEGTGPQILSALLVALGAIFIYCAMSMLIAQKRDTR